LTEPASATQSPRPNARAGVFETILVFEDRPIELDAHLARLAASVRQLYGVEPPPARDLVVSRSRGGWLGRLRLDVAPDAAGELRASIVVAPFDPNNVFPTGPFTTELRTVRVDRGYGDHKWTDREMLVREESRAGPDAVPLLVTAGGEALEASRANVFAVSGGTILTPPLDGAILPGVARAGVIEVAAELGLPLREEVLPLATLRGAEEAFLTGSLRGVEPVRALDGEPLPSEGPLTTALAAGLRHRWFAGSP
jgi:para-aminobenzoate synthetase/4-amino-4-deoxychorismate lyase